MSDPYFHTLKRVKGYDIRLHASSSSFRRFDLSCLLLNIKLNDHESVLWWRINFLHLSYKQAFSRTKNPLLKRLPKRDRQNRFLKRKRRISSQVRKPVNKPSRIEREELVWFNPPFCISKTLKIGVLNVLSSLQAKPYFLLYKRLSWENSEGNQIKWDDFRLG